MKLEKFADILIADSERKDAPPNSVSWKYIDLSVRNGVLEDVEKHRIHRPSAAQRAVGSTAPAKKTRTKFTLHDDMILTKHVHEMEAMGESVGGNGMWPILEAKCPNHTWQSWKDRWHKFLRDRPRLDISQLEDGGPAHSRTEPAQAEKEAVIALPPTRTLTKTGPGMSSRDVVDGHGADVAEQDMAPVPRGEATKQGPLMADIVAGPSKRRVISPQANAPNPRVAEVANPKPSHLPTSSSKDVGEQATDASPTTRFKAALSQPPPGLTKAEGLRWKFLMIRAVIMAQRFWRGKMVRAAIRSFNHDLVDLQARAKGFITRRALLDEGEDALDGAEHVVLDSNLNKEVFESQGDPLTHKQAFYTYLNLYMKGTGSEINHFPTIQGRTLDLWDLWHTVISLDEGGHTSARNWEIIAEQLGFDWVATPEVVTQLQKCYSKNLGEFEELLIDFEGVLGGVDDATRVPNVAPQSSAKSGIPEMDAEGEDEEPEEVGDRNSGVKSRVHGAHTGQRLPMQPDSDLEMGEAEPLSDGLPFRSSPPPIRGQKRAYEDDDAESVDLGTAFDQVPTHLESISAHSLARSKRARYDEASTIPSTPDGKADVSRLRQPSEHQLAESTRWKPGDDVDPIPYARLPDAANGHTAATTQIRAHEGSPSRKAAKPRRDYLTSRAEEVAMSTAQPYTTQVQQEPLSPVQIKRRSLPQSFKRTVTPPRAGPGPVTARLRQSMPALHDGMAHPVVTVSQSRQSLPTTDKGKGKAVERPYRPRHVSMLGQAKPSSQAPARPPSTNPATSRSAGKPLREVKEMVQFFTTFYGPNTVHDVVKGTGANKHLMNILCDRVEEARKRGTSTNLNLLTNEIKGYWRKKDDARLAFIDDFETGQNVGLLNAREKLQKRKEYVEAKESLVRRFGREGIKKRREFLKAYLNGR